MRLAIANFRSKLALIGLEISTGSGIWSALKEGEKQLLMPIKDGVLIMLSVARATYHLILFWNSQTYEECQQVRRIADQPMKLMKVTGVLLHGSLLTAQICALKFQILGDQQTRRVRDYLVDNRIAVVAEDIWGGDIASQP